MLPVCCCVCMQVAAADTALHLTGMSVSKYDNVVPPSVSLGTKATVRLAGWLAGCGVMLVLLHMSAAQRGSLSAAAGAPALCGWVCAVSLGTKATPWCGCSGGVL